MKKFWEFVKKNIKYIMFGIVCLVLLVLVIYLINLQLETQSQQEIINKSIVEMKQLGDGIVRSQTKYATKDDVEKFCQDINLDKIKDDLKKLNASLQGISEIIIRSQGDHRIDQPTYIIYPNTDPSTPLDPIPIPKSGCEDPLKPWCLSSSTAEYMVNAQVFKLEEPFIGKNIPVGDVTFKAWKEKPWSVNIHPRDYKIKSVLGQDKEGKHYLYHKFTIKTNGEEHVVDINDAKFVEELPKSSFEWWNPKIAMGLSAGVSIPTTPISSDGLPTGVQASIAPGIYFSPFTYGKTKVKPNWIFAQVGVGYNVVGETWQFSLSPAKYNLGSDSSIINNTYIGPTIGVDTEKNISLGGTLSVTF